MPQDPPPPPTQIVEYYHLDILGSVRAVTDEQGNVIARHDFLPFGEELNPQTSSRERNLFTGQERDFETGLDYFNARQYRPDLGQFTAPDPMSLVPEPVGSQALGSYTYVSNSPLDSVDPSGMFGISFGGLSWGTGWASAWLSFAFGMFGGGAGWQGGGMPMGSAGSFSFSFSWMPSSSAPDQQLAALFALRGPSGTTGRGPATPGSSLASSGGLGRLKSAYCSVVPSGRSASLSTAWGAVGAVSGGADMVLNYNSGQSSLFLTGGGSLGWNGAVSLTFTTGLVYGLDDTNDGFSGVFKGANLFVPTPIPFVGAGGSRTSGGGVTVTSIGLGAALLGRINFGGSVTNTTRPLNIGRFVGFTEADYLGYLLRRPCSY